MESPNPTSNTNVVSVPVPVLPPEGYYVYIAVKGSLHSKETAIFGLSAEETVALIKRYANCPIEILNGISVKGHPLHVVNSLSELGYKVICSTGEAEIIWTMEREVSINEKK